MSRYSKAIAAILIALALGACAGSTPPSVKIADKLLEAPACAENEFAKECLDGRAVRAAEVSRVYIAVLSLDPNPADYGRAFAMLLAVKRLESARDDPFIDTELAFFRVAFGRLVAEDIGEDVSLLNIVDIAAVANERLSQIEVAWGGLRDAERRLQALADGTLSVDQAWTELSARMERDVRRMEPVLDISPGDIPDADMAS